MNEHEERAAGFGRPRSRGRSGPAGRGPRGPSRDPARGARGESYGRGPASERRAACPPELREVFISARDFLAGLIAQLGLPARLSFGGVEPARDGRQVIIEIHALDGNGAGNGGGRDAGRRRSRRAHEDDDLAILIGKHGATLEALSAVTNAFMQKAELRGVFFAVDVEGYRARREAALRAIAQRCAHKVVDEGVAVELEPMPAAERRIVHLELASHPDVATESTGSGRDRRVVIMPRGSRLEPPPEDDEDFT
jgi:predicted RNA-binding protein Jag